MRASIDGAAVGELECLVAVADKCKEADTIPLLSEVTALAGSPFLTGGTGLNNPTAVGPNDFGYPLIATVDRRALSPTVTLPRE